MHCQVTQKRSPARKRALVLASLLLLLFAASTGQSDDKAQDLVGIVTRGWTGSMVDGATIQAYDASKSDVEVGKPTTSREGKFTLKELPGRRKLIVRASFKEDNSSWEGSSQIETPHAEVLPVAVFQIKPANPNAYFKSEAKAVVDAAAKLEPEKAERLYKLIRPSTAFPPVAMCMVANALKEAKESVSQKWTDYFSDYGDVSVETLFRFDAEVATAIATGRDGPKKSSVLERKIPTSVVADAVGYRLATADLSPQPNKAMFEQDLNNEWGATFVQAIKIKWDNKK